MSCENKAAVQLILIGNFFDGHRKEIGNFSECLARGHDVEETIDR